MLVTSLPHDGHAFESEFCGCTFKDVDAELRKGIRSFDEGLKKVKERQCAFNNWNPRKPRTALAECLFRRVASRLRNKEELRLFIAINTMLDYRMGIDCFFEYDRRIATIDLTVSSFKKYFKAHFLLTRRNFERDEHYHIGDLIAKKLSQ